MIGVTTALVFRALGHKVHIISRQFLWESSTDPSFASVYPAASVIPHTVGGDTQELYQISNTLFKHLCTRFPGAVRAQKHLELTEGSSETKAYFAWMNAREVSIEKPLWGCPVPRRKGAGQVSGVGFDIAFVDMPVYAQLLKEWVWRLGIKITHQEVTAEAWASLCEEDFIICNCLGINGADVIHDPVGMHGVAGILVRFPVTGLYKNRYTNSPVSYNYEFDGGEVYTYPRVHDIVFGGTRIPVDSQKDPALQVANHFEMRHIPYRYIQSIPVPNDLIELNAQLNEQLYNVPISIKEPHVILGLRPVRRGGVRLDAVPVGASSVINSYGYGGAGVTLSWGAAVKTARLAGDSTDEKKILHRLLDLV